MFNTDLNNALTRANKTELITWGMPDYTSKTDITHSLPYTADTDGFIFAGVSGNSYQITSVNGSSVAVCYNTGVSSSYPQICVPVKKGDIFDTAANVNWVYFYKCMGA